MFYFEMFYFEERVTSGHIIGAGVSDHASLRGSEHESAWLD